MLLLLLLSLWLLLLLLLLASCESFVYDFARKGCEPRLDGHYSTLRSIRGVSITSKEENKCNLPTHHGQKNAPYRRHLSWSSPSTGIPCTRARRAGSAG